ncbi:MAG: Mor transcription activator family protein [Methylobacter sp.]
MNIEPYQALGEILSAQLATHSINPAASGEIQRHFIEAVKRHFAGHAVYFKSEKALKTAETHRQIAQEFDGSNHQELMTKYQIGAAWLSKIIKRNKDSK